MSLCLSMSRWKFMDFSEFVKHSPWAVADKTTLLPSWFKAIFLWALSPPLAPLHCAPLFCV